MDYRICRLCLTSHQEVALLKIFGQEGLDGLISKMQSVLPFRVSVFDGLPKYVCYKCCTLIDQWHTFVTNAVKSNDALLKNFGPKGRAIALDKSSDEDEMKLNQRVNRPRHSLMIQQRQQATWVLSKRSSSSEDTDNSGEVGNSQDIQPVSLDEVRERTRAKSSLPSTQESIKIKPSEEPEITYQEIEMPKTEKHSSPMDTSSQNKVQKTEPVVKQPVPIHPSAFHTVPYQYNPYHHIAMYQQYPVYGGFQPDNGPNGFQPNTAEPMRINNGTFQSMPFHPSNGPILPNASFVPNNGPIIPNGSFVPNNRPILHNNFPYQNGNFQLNNTNQQFPTEIQNQRFPVNQVPNPVISQSDTEMVPNCSNEISQFNDKPEIVINESTQQSQQFSNVSQNSQEYLNCQIKNKQEKVNEVVKQELLPLMKNVTKNNYGQEVPKIGSQNAAHSNPMEIAGSQMVNEKPNSQNSGGMKINSSQNNKENVVKQKYSDVVKTPLTPHNNNKIVVDNNHTPMFEDSYNLNLNFCKNCNLTLSPHDNLFKHMLKCAAKKK